MPPRSQPLWTPPTLPIPYKLRAATELETLAFPCEPLLDMARSDPGTGGILYRNALALSSRRWGQALQQYRCHFLMLLEARDLQASKELRTIRQQLLQSSRLAVLGGLLSSVAHEVKNPLTGILGFTQLLLRRDLGQEMRRDVTIIQQEAERISHIVHSMLSFSRKREPARNPVCLNETIERTLALQEYRLRVTNIQVVKDLQANLPLVLADYHQLQQVFLNLILNAQQAMTDAHGGGTLIMQTRQAGTHLRAIVADDGVGIPSEYTDRIFDPFFTTKGEGKGTGLGLSLCQAIVQEHGGSIRVESQPGQGSKFILELPLAAQSDALVAVSA